MEYTFLLLPRALHRRQFHIPTLSNQFRECISRHLQTPSDPLIQDATPLHTRNSPRLDAVRALHTGSIVAAVQICLTGCPSAPDSLAPGLRALAGATDSAVPRAAHAVTEVRGSSEAARTVHVRLRVLAAEARASGVCAEPEGLGAACRTAARETVAATLRGISDVGERGGRGGGGELTPPHGPGGTRAVVGLC